VPHSRPCRLRADAIALRTGRRARGIAPPRIADAFRITPPRWPRRVAWPGRLSGAGLVAQAGPHRWLFLIRHSPVQAHAQPSRCYHPSGRVLPAHQPAIPAPEPQGDLRAVRAAGAERADGVDKERRQRRESVRAGPQPVRADTAERRDSRQNLYPSRSLPQLRVAEPYVPVADLRVANVGQADQDFTRMGAGLIARGCTPNDQSDAITHAATRTLRQRHGLSRLSSAYGTPSAASYWLDHLSWDQLDQSPCLPHGFPDDGRQPVHACRSVLLRSGSRGERTPSCTLP